MKEVMVFIRADEIGAEHPGSGVFFPKPSHQVETQLPKIIGHIRVIRPYRYCTAIDPLHVLVANFNVAQTGLVGNQVGVGELANQRPRGFQLA